jgi:DNA-directed RNA polymerase alpha subunit
MKAVVEITYTDSQIREILSALSIPDCKTALSILKKRIEREEEKEFIRKEGITKLDDTFLDMGVEELNLHQRILNRLKENELNKVRDIVDTGIDRLKTFRGIGERTAQEIKKEIFQN